MMLIVYLYLGFLGLVFIIGMVRSTVDTLRKLRTPQGRAALRVECNKALCGVGAMLLWQAVFFSFFIRDIREALFAALPYWLTITGGWWLLHRVRTRREGRKDPFWSSPADESPAPRPARKPDPPKTEPPPEEPPGPPYDYLATGRRDRDWCRCR